MVVDYCAARVAVATISSMTTNEAKIGGVVALCALLTISCADTDEGRDAARDAHVDTPSTSLDQRDMALAATVDSVRVVFTRGEAPSPVRRPGRPGRTPIESALDALFAGPTDAERAAGIRSWFSDATAGMLRSVIVDSSGHVIVDLRDLSAVIPNAGSSTGSTLLLTELNGTVFGFDEVRSVEYRIDGSCDAFWDWLQYGCHTVSRAEAT